MGFRRALISIARAAALAALVLGTVFSVRGITINGLSIGANFVKADDTLDNVLYFPLISSPRDDLLSAESNLPVRSVSAGYAHACAVRLDGSLICWGLNVYGQASPPPGVFEQVAAGANHTCALRGDGSIACWGDNTYGQASPPAGVFTQVSAGGYHSCAVGVDGSLACWGWNAFQQLDGIPSGAFTQVAAGNLHTCALSVDGSVHCWGWNADGQTNAPAGAFIQVAAGGAHSCAAAADGTVTCWGSNLSGELNVPEGSYSAVGAGSFHSCALGTDGTITCWGSNGYGQLLDIPTGAFQQISVGGQHTCAVRAGTGTLACWGWNRFGQSFPPSGVIVSAGREHACAVRVDGSLSCWGENNYGQSNPPAGAFTHVSAADRYSCAVRSDGTLACWGRDTDSLLVPPGGIYLDVSAGSNHACALDLNGLITCWGDTTEGKTSPPAGVYSMVSAGANHTCALRLDGGVSCWGSNSAGQWNVPEGAFTQVSAGGDHACARSTLGTLACWGADDWGQAEPPAGTFAQVSAGSRHTCGVRADGTALCWGSNQAGESTPPEGVFSQISAGEGYSCGVRLDGTLSCWGAPIVAPQIVISPEALPDAEAGLNYFIALQASGGTPPYTFHLAAGTLPEGLTLSSEGVLSGVPEEDGLYSFTIDASDSGDPRFAGQRSYTLQVLPRQIVDTTPPVIEVELAGPPGMNGWYTGPVSVSWRVYDPESPVQTTSGCDPLTLTGDTPGTMLTCQAESAGGQSSSSVTVKIDQTPPVGVTAIPDREPQNGWYNRPLTITFSGVDATSGIAACSVVEYSGPDSQNAEVSGSCTDQAGNVSVPVTFHFKYDATAPTLNPVVEPNPVYLNGTAVVVPNASDNLSGVVEVICDPLDTSTIGEHSLACQAVDATGNRAEATTTYHVIFRFVGFFPPVENPPLINQAVAGQAIPVKFEILDANEVPVTTLETFVIRLEETICDPALLSDTIEELYLDEAVDLKNLGGGRYLYVWKTSEALAGTCQAVTVDLGEGAGYGHTFLVYFRK